MNQDEQNQQGWNQDRERTESANPSQPRRAAEGIRRKSGNRDRRDSSSIKKCSRKVPSDKVSPAADQIKQTTLKTDFGRLELGGKKSPVFRIGQQKVHILRIESSLRHSMKRTQCIAYLKQASTHEATMSLWVDGTAGVKKDDWQYRDVDAATVLILAIGLQRDDQDSDKNVAELIGLSQPSTAQYLVQYIHPAWIKWHYKTVTELVHATARNVGQSRTDIDEGHGSLLLFRYVPQVIAKLFASMPIPKPPAKGRKGDRDPNVEQQIESFRQLIDDIFSRHEKDGAESNQTSRKKDADEARDRGMEVGLVLAGVRRWLRSLDAKEDKNFDRAKLVLEVIFGGLSGVPLAGPAFSATIPIITRSLKGIQDKLKNDRESVWEKVSDMFVYGVEDKRLPCKTERDLFLLDTYWTWKRAVLDAEGPKL